MRINVACWVMTSQFEKIRIGFRHENAVVFRCIHTGNQFKKIAVSGSQKVVSAWMKHWYYTIFFLGIQLNASMCGWPLKGSLGEGERFYHCKLKTMAPLRKPSVFLNPATWISDKYQKTNCLTIMCPYGAWFYFTLQTHSITFIRIMSKVCLTHIMKSPAFN